MHKSVLQHQQAQQMNHDKTAVDREIRVNDNVYVRNFGKGDKWLPGEIVKCTGPVSYKVKTNDGIYVRRHADQVRVSCAENESESHEPHDCHIPKAHSSASTKEVTTDLVDPTRSNLSRDFEPSGSAQSEAERVGTPIQGLVRRSRRSVKPPDKLDL